MEYKEALEWLLSRTKIDFEHGVERVKWLLNELGNPQESYPTVHFVGTNGKGSTLNALAEILMASGYRVGRFSSPSIFDYREQVVYQGQMLSEEELERLVTRLVPLVERLPFETNYGEASEFEILTVIMFLYFACYREVDVVLVEAGMGGLLDATNVLQPLVLVCPSIGLDHQAFLGETYADIARHKVAALKTGVPLVYASQEPSVQAVFEEKARECGSTTYALNREFTVQGRTKDFRFISSFGMYEHLGISMLGQHQIENAGIAIMTAELLQPSFPKVTATSIQLGLKRAVWHGRLERLASNILIDGAHNKEGIAVLCHFLQEEYAGCEIEVLFAAIHTKPVTEMLEQLAQYAHVTVTSFSDPRALHLDDYPKDYDRIASFQEWVEKITPQNSQKVYVITGSLYFIQEVRKYVTERNG